MTKLEMLNLQLEAAKETVRMIEEKIASESPQRTVVVEWSENTGFKDGETFITKEEISEINKRFAYLNEGINKLNNYGYDKTKFTIRENNEVIYTGRYDLGDYSKFTTLEDHILGSLKMNKEFNHIADEEYQEWLTFINSVFN